MIDWEAPLRMVPRQDSDGGYYGPSVHLVAMLDDDGKVVPLSPNRIGRDITDHFRQQFGQGVRFMVKADGQGGNPIYYKADGTPWLSHHANLMNEDGPRTPLGEMEAKAIEALRKIEEARRQAHAALRERREKAAQATIDAKLAEERAQDEIEANPLWGTF
jgi:hypothetical protein